MQTGLAALSELDDEEMTKAKTIMIEVSVIYNQLYHKLILIALLSSTYYQIYINESSFGLWRKRKDICLNNHSFPKKLISLHS